MEAMVMGMEQADMVWGMASEARNILIIIRMMMMHSELLFRLEMLPQRKC